MAPATDPGRGARGTREDTCLVFAATSAVINSRDQRREEEEQLTGQDSSTASLEICCPSSSTTSTIASLSKSIKTFYFWFILNFIKMIQMMKKRVYTIAITLNQIQNILIKN